MVVVGANSIIPHCLTDKVHSVIGIKGIPPRDHSFNSSEWDAEV